MPNLNNLEKNKMKDCGITIYDVLYPFYQILDKGGLASGYNTHYAVMMGHINMVKQKLIKENYNINEIDKYGTNGLHAAILTKNISKKMIEFLLENGVNINAKTTACKYASTALHLIIERASYCETNQKVTKFKEDIEIIKLLLNYGANINERNNIGQTAIEFAKHLKCTTVIDILEKHFNSIDLPPSYEEAIRLSNNDDLQNQVSPSRHLKSPIL